MALDACERRAKEASSSFVASFGSLPAMKRAAVNAVYAYCRWVDDIVDGDADERLSITPEVLEFSKQRMNELVEVHGRRPSDPQDMALEVGSPLSHATSASCLCLR